MHFLKSTKTLTAAALILSLFPQVRAQTPQPSSADLKLLAQCLSDKKYSKKEQLQTQLQAAQYLASILAVNPAEIAKTKQVNPMIIQDLSQVDTTKEEMDALRAWALMVDQNTLKPNVRKLIEGIKSCPTSISQQLQTLPADKQEYAVAALTSSIEAITRMRGLTADASLQTYKEWSKLSKHMLKEVDKSDAGEALDLAGSEWVRTESAEILVNGPESFAKRDQFMSEALESINILTWSIYDDMTGTQAVDLLLKKKQENPNLKIRVIVDGQVAATPGHGVQVARLEAAGVEVIRWFNPDLNYMGQHRKMLIVDNQHMIAGGLNFGDVYSHKNPDPSIKRWRDTDIYVKGAGAVEGNRLFAKIWNDQLKQQRKLKFDKMRLADSEASSAGSVEISVINHDPSDAKDGSTIMLTILKAIRESKQSVDIENAYIILFPALRQEISAAIARGVKVRVFTNSSESVDEPVVSIPILRSVGEFIKMGAQVFVKKGATLHSKIMVVDSDLSLVMSYNLHPRSERVEGEMAIAVRGADFAQKMHRLFDEDVTTDKATELKSLSDLKIPSSPVSVPTLRLFFDML